MRVLFRRPFYVPNYKLFEVANRGVEVPDKFRNMLPKDAKIWHKGTWATMKEIEAGHLPEPPQEGEGQDEALDVDEPSPDQPMSLSELAAKRKLESGEATLRRKAKGK